MTTILDAVLDKQAQEAKANRRERIATAAMQGLLANVEASESWSMKSVPALAVDYADALIAELEGGNE